VLAVAAVLLVVLGWLGSREVFRARSGRTSTAAPDGSETRAAPVETASSEAGKEKGRGEEEGGIPYRVRVVSRRDGSPIAGAKIIDGEQILRGVTREDGTLAFKAESDWWRASAPGYFSVSGQYDQEGNGWAALPPATVVTGRVFDAVTGEGVAGAEVKLWADDDGLGYETTTSGEGGRFEVSGALWQGFYVEVRAEGYCPDSLIGAELTGPRSGVDIGLARGATLEGHVFDADGMPAIDVAIGLEAKGERLSYLGARSGEEGRYRIDGVPTGVELRPLATFEQCAGETVVLRDAGEVQQRDIRFPSPVRLDAAAIDADGKPLAICRVTLEGGYRRDLGRTEKGWAFEAAAGRYVLKMMPYGWPEQTREITLAAGRQQEEAFVFSGGLAIEGALVAPDGTPESWTIGWSNATLSGVARADEAGRFRIDGLPAAPVDLFVDPWGLAVATREGVLPGGPPVVIVLKPAARIVGRLVDVADPGELWTDLWCDSLDGGCDRMESDGSFEFLVSYVGEPVVVSFRRDLIAPPTLFSLPGLAPGEVRDLGEVRLVSGRDVRGRVVDAEGNPVIGARIGIAEPWASRSPPEPTRSDDGGLFCLLRVPPDPFRVRVDAKGFPPRFATVGAASAEIRLTAGGLAEGPGRGRFRLAVVSEWADNAYVEAEGDRASFFRVPMQPGEYRGWIDLPNGGRFEALPFVVREGETTRVEIKPR